MLLTEDCSERVYTLDFKLFFRVLWKDGHPSAVEQVRRFCHTSSLDFTSPTNPELFEFLVRWFRLTDRFWRLYRRVNHMGARLEYQEFDSLQDVYRVMESDGWRPTEFRTAPGSCIEHNYDLSSSIWAVKSAITGEGDSSFIIFTGEQGVQPNSGVLLKRLGECVPASIEDLSNPGFYQFRRGDVVRWSRLRGSMGKVMFISDMGVKVLLKDGRYRRIPIEKCSRSYEPFELDRDASDYLPQSLVEAVDGFVSSGRAIADGKCPQCGADLAGAGCRERTVHVCRCGLVYGWVPEFEVHVAGGQLERPSIELGFAKCCASCFFKSRHAEVCTIHGNACCQFSVCDDWTPSLMSFMGGIKASSKLYRCRPGAVDRNFLDEEVGADHRIAKEDINCMRRLEDMIEAKARQLSLVASERLHQQNQEAEDDTGKQD